MRQSCQRQIRRGEQSAAVNWLIAARVSAVVLLIDQSTKWAAVHYLPPDVSVPLIGRFLRLTLVYNRGIAFGLPLSIGMILGIAILVIILLLYCFSHRKTPKLDTSSHNALPAKALSIPIGMGIGAAVGNSVDRIRLGAVIDYIDLGFWPVFNIADIALTCSAVFLAIFLIFGTQKRTLNSEL